MEISLDLCSIDGEDGDFRASSISDCCVPSTSAAPPPPPASPIGRKSPFLQMTTVTLRRQRGAVFSMIIVATAGWLLFERSGLPFLSVCCDILLVLVVMLFLRANYAVYRKKKLQPLPELVLTEEMVNNAAASFRAKINYMLLMAHDITLGKDFKLFFKAVIFLWFLSVVGSALSFFTIAYIGTVIAIIVPALYNRFKDQIDRRFSRQYRVVDESISRLPRNLVKVLKDKAL